MTNASYQTPVVGDHARGSGDSVQPADEPGSSGAEAAQSSFLERFTRIFRSRKAPTLREDLADALSSGNGETASFSATERTMLNNILRLRETRVEDVMVPRADVDAIEESATLAEMLDQFEKSGHSRMPVYCETLDDPRGMIHIRDVVAYLTRTARVAANGTGEGVDLSAVDLDKRIADTGLIRPVLFVPPSMLASDLMGHMQAARTQMALVIDEYGGTDGLVSLEDLVELVVGDIEDEHDDDEEVLITRVADGVYLADAKAEIDDVAEVIGEAFNPGEHVEDVDTIGGLIFNVLGRIPARGEVVQAIPGYEFHIVEADPRRIKRVRIVQARSGDRRRRAARAAEA